MCFNSYKRIELIGLLNLSNVATSISFNKIANKGTNANE